MIVSDKSLQCLVCVEIETDRHKEGQKERARVVVKVAHSGECVSTLMIPSRRVATQVR